MKYDSKIFHIIINHITSKSQYHIYISLPQKKEFIFKFQEPPYVQQNILRTIIIFRVH